MKHHVSQGGQTPHEIFADHLKRHNMNMTSQRRVILDTFFQCREHVTSEELYELVHETDQGVGLATVFRTLKLLEECGLAELVRFKDGLKRFEPVFGREHHDHMVCDACGREFEVSDPELEALLQRLANQAGFSLSGHTTFLTGVCEACQKKGLR